jgi:hypothetical protein
MSSRTATIALGAALLFAENAANAITYRWENITAPTVNSVVISMSGLVTINDPFASGVSGHDTCCGLYLGTEYFGLDFIQLGFQGTPHGRDWIVTNPDWIAQGWVYGTHIFSMTGVGAGPFDIDLEHAGQGLSGALMLDNSEAQISAVSDVHGIWTIVSFASDVVPFCRPETCSGGTGRFVRVLEPGTLALLGFGLASLGLTRQRRTN